MEKRICICVTRNYNKVELELTLDQEEIEDVERYLIIRDGLIEEANTMLDSVTPVVQQPVYQQPAQGYNPGVPSLATAKQVAWLKSLGVPNAETFTMDQANAYIQSHRK